MGTPTSIGIFTYNVNFLGFYVIIQSHISKTEAAGFAVADGIAGWFYVCV